MNPFDYRIRSRKDSFRAVVTEVLEPKYVNVRLADTRLLRFVRTEQPLQAGDRISVVKVNNRWEVSL